MEGIEDGMAKKEPVFLLGDEGKAIVELIGGVFRRDFTCAGKPMGPLRPTDTEGAGEKHLPRVHINGNEICVKVGEVPHPMDEAHSIQWIYLQTEKGSQRRMLKPGSPAEATFLVPEDDRAVAVYAYCDLHGFWKTEIDG
ncbi:MAG: desulfoferrodoxin family protein [bacterium]|nr:desulfoferrodoxin family protein [bacterium]